MVDVRSTLGRSAVVGLLLAVVATATVTRGGPGFADLLPPSTDRVSVTSGGGEGSTPSQATAISDDERVVAVDSAFPFTPGDTNGVVDVLLKSRLSGEVTVASVSDDEQPGNGPSSGARLSGDGLTVAFVSAATNLVPGDTNGEPDVFVRDVVAGTTVRVSTSSTGGQATAQSWPVALSAEGDHVLFGSAANGLVAADTNGVPDLFVRDLSNGALELVAVGNEGQSGNGHTQAGDLSADGQIVAFGSVASNLTADDTNGYSDIFVRDRVDRQRRKGLAVLTACGRGVQRCQRRAGELVLRPQERAAAEGGGVASALST